MEKSKDKQRLQFGYISPTSMLDQCVPVQARFHLCLAHLCDDPNYCDFYKEKRQRGDIIFMDNSAFELGGSIEPRKLLDLIEGSEINPQLIIAPDYPGKPAKNTLNSFTEFKSIIIDEFDGRYDLMGVPQSEIGDWAGWVTALREMQELTKTIGMSILGIPNAARNVTQTKDISYNRNWATQWLKMYGIVDPEHWYHYLGAGDPSEVRLQALAGVACSMDTSSPIWHGLLGREYDNTASGLEGGKSKISVDFDMTVDNNGIGLDNNNVTARQRMVQNNINYIEDSCIR